MPKYFKEHPTRYLMFQSLLLIFETDIYQNRRYMDGKQIHRRVNEKIVTDFLELIEKLPEVIDAYGIKKTYLSKQSKIPRATLDRKLKSKAFHGEELLLLVKAINR